MKFLWWILGILVLALPLLVFGNVWVAFQGYELEEQVEELQALQAELVERNKRLITGISVLRSPGRIIEEARKLGMGMPEAGQIIFVQNNF